MTTISRRALLSAAALLPLAGCTNEKSQASPSTQESVPTPAPSVSPSASTEQHPQLIDLEQQHGVRLGVYAVAIDTGTAIAHRADDRWAFCSAFKVLAAAALLRDPQANLDKRIRYTEQDLLLPDSAPITQQNVATGMTLRGVCDAAIRYSDGTAGNLLLREVGGTAALTEYLRTGLGDTVTRSVRTEPTLQSEWTPGDLRDTTTPQAFGEDLRQIVLGDVLPAAHRRFLRGLLENATVRQNSRTRIRAGVPDGWKVANKTGTGGFYGIANDFAIAWPPNSTSPLVIAIMSDQTAKDATPSDAVVAQAATYVAQTLGQ
jgi:beta-lactamase class A